VIPPGATSVPEYYDAQLHWPAESLARRQALLQRVQAYRAAPREPGAPGPPRPSGAIAGSRPLGLASVTPYFFVDGAERFVQFLVDGLGGTETLRHLRPDGHIANAQVAFGACTVMVGEASAAYPAMRASHYLRVDDARSAVQRALRHGAALVMDVADMPYGDRQGGVRDAHGNLWWISQRLADGPNV
jgi:PhnB protein